MADQREQREQDRGGDERPVSPREAYGSGIALATREDVRQGRAQFLWDPLPDARGAFAGRHGVSELSKDVAFRMARQSHRIRTGLLDPNAKASLELEIRRIVEDDSRVNAVRDVTVREARRPDTIECEFEFIGNGGEINDGVFPYYTDGSGGQS